ncbi:MAG: addiction module killer protein [bacterium]|nr:MAG: addiction module killer protein [bacterium]
MPDATEREISYYADIKGNMPFREWLKTFTDQTTLAKINIRIVRVRNGLLGDCESVGAGVYELRIDYGPGYRVYFGQVGTQVVLLLCGGDKSSQNKDIKKAINYWKDYKLRNKLKQ